jgi:Flp pilus assembly protein TadD
MDLTEEQDHETARIGNDVVARRLFLVLGFALLTYSFLAGLHTLTDFDLGWQLATGRWVVQHREIPSTDVFSYTAYGQPWVYPIGSGLLFYLAYGLGGYTALCWLGAIACVGTTALLLRRGNLVSAIIVLLAIPVIAARTTPRADMFTVVLFAAFLSLLWQQYRTGGAPLWILPVLMAAWVNLHLGFLAGLALVVAYIAVELLEMVWPERRRDAGKRLRRSLPWLILTPVATLANTWGWNIYSALFRQQALMGVHSEAINEWRSARITWSRINGAWSLLNPDSLVVMLLLVAIAVGLALWRRRAGAAALMSAAAFLGYRHNRFQASFAVVTVIVASPILGSGIDVLSGKIKDARIKATFAVGVTSLLLIVITLNSFDLVTDRAYLSATDAGSFGTGLSWWFPEGAASFIEREKIPGNIFNTYNEGGYFTWRLGPSYSDYIDGRAIPFGAELFDRNGRLMVTPPESPEWSAEADRYHITAIMVPIGRHGALQFFPVLRQFCSSENWRPVYLDEVSAVFLRVRPDTETLIQRLQIDCFSAALPRSAPAASGSIAFNQWANAAAVLNALGREEEAFAATTKALAIFPNNAFVHFLRGNLFYQANDLRGAEQEYLSAARLEPNGANWSALATLYQREGRLDSEIDAWQHAIDLLPIRDLALLSLGYADLNAHRPREALDAFEKAVAEQSARTNQDSSFLANVAHGQAIAWISLGNLASAIPFAEETVRLAPDRADDWIYLANLYDQAGRSIDAGNAREHILATPSLNGKP